MSFRIRRIPRYITLLLWISSQSAWGACTGIGCTCVVSSSAAPFGNYSSLSGSAVDTTANVQVVCSVLVVGLNVSYTIASSTGNAGSYTPRQMTFSSYALPYNLYTDAAYTQIWGNGTSGTNIISDSYVLALLSQTRNYTIYGRIPAGQNVAPGAYNDTIVVTLTF